MKKIKFILSMMALVAGTSMLSSCFSDPAAGELPQMTVTDDASYTVTVSTNVNAKLTYNGATVTSPFKPTGNGTLVVAANGYVAQTIPVNLGDNRNIVLDVKLIRVPVSSVTVDNANQNTTGVTTIANSTENRSEYGAASISVPAAATTSGVDPDETFGIGVYEVAATAAAGQSVSSDVIVAVCEPSGARFNAPVTISVPAEQAAGLSFSCRNGNETASDLVVADNSVSAQVMHFSEWKFSLNASVLSVNTQEETVYDATILVNQGSNTFTYTANTGVSSSRGGIVEAFLISQFGSKARKVTMTGSLSSEARGSVHIRVVQTKKVVRYKSANVEFEATVYGALRTDIVSSTYDTSGHSGGAGRN